MQLVADAPVSGMNILDGQVFDGINACEIRSTFTNPATGRWVTYQGAVVIKNIFVDNGDGTISLHTWAGGLQEMIKQSGGPPLEGINAGEIRWLERSNWLSTTRADSSRVDSFRIETGDT